MTTPTQPQGITLRYLFLDLRRGEGDDVDGGGGPAGRWSVSGSRPRR